MAIWNKNMRLQCLGHVLFSLVLGFVVIGCGESEEQRTARMTKEEVRKLDLDFDKGINTNSVLERLHELAEANVPSAQGVLSAKFFLLGNFEKAKYWADKAIEGGDGRGMNTLGLLYKNGSGNCVKSLEKAFEWFEKSARAGCSKGYLNMGFSYLYGEGCKKSSTDALLSVSEAAQMKEAGDDIPIRIFQVLYYVKEGGEKNMAEAYSRISAMPEDVLVSEGEPVGKAALPSLLLCKALLYFGKKGDLAAERKIAKALSNAKSSEFQWFGRYKMLMFDFKESPSKREDVISELKSMSETSNAWQRAQVCLQLGQVHSRVKPFINYREAVSWLEKAISVGVGTKEAVSELIALRKIYIDDFPPFMKQACPNAAADNTVNFSIGHGLMRGICFKKDMENAERWLVEAARRGSVEAYIDLSTIWDKRAKGVSANRMDCFMNWRFCLRQAALLKGVNPEGYKVDPSEEMVSFDAQASSKLSRIFGVECELEYLQPRMAEYNKGILSVADSAVLPKKDSKDLPLDELFENPKGCVDDPDGLKSIFGVQFGAVVKKNIEPAYRNDNGELVYRFTPKKKFLTFDEYAISASPITRRVVTISAHTYNTYYDDDLGHTLKDHNWTSEDQIDKIAMLLEAKYRRSAVDEDLCKVIWFRNKREQRILIGPSTHHGIIIKAIDQKLQKESNKEYEQVKRQSILQKDGAAIDAL